MAKSDTNLDPEAKLVGGNKIDLAVEIMRAAGLEDNEIVRLAGLRRRVAVGDCTEVTPEHKRLEFCRYLLETSRLTDEMGEAA